MKKKSKTLVYCGPNIQGILPQYSVFYGEIPNYLQEHTTKCKELKQLFVQTTELAKTRANLNKKGSREVQLYNQALNYIKSL